MDSVVVNKVEKRCKANKSEFREIWPGVKRCMECGFALAYLEDDEKKEVSHKTSKGIAKEETLHSTYHGKYYKVKSEYGSQNVLSYKELENRMSTIESSLQQIKEYEISSDIVELKNLFDVILLYMTEINKWGKTFKDTHLDLYSGMKDKINKVRAIARKKDSNDFEELLSALYNILKELRGLFKNIVEIGNLRLSNETLYKDISFPNFTFNQNDVINVLENKVQVIPAKIGKMNGILDDFFRIEFTRSLRLWDMCKPHPKFEDFKVLLWNTSKFTKYISKYLSTEQLNNFIENNKANRTLVDFDFEDAPFYFGKVEEVVYKENEKIKDLSYLDKLIETFDDEEEDTATLKFEKSKEYKDIQKALKLIADVATKGA